MKVLMITTVKVGYDGLTNHIFSYVKNMNKEGMEIDLVSARGTDEKIIPQLNEVGFHQIHRLEYRDTNQIKYALDLMNLIKKNKYDIIHAHGNSATLATEMVAAMLAGCKIRIAHSHSTSCGHKMFNACLKPIFLVCCTNGFACSDAAGKWLFGNREFTVIPNGKELDKYVYSSTIREQYRKELGLDSKKIALCYVAAFVKMKNHSFLIDVFKALNKETDKYELYLFGIDGNSLEETLAKIKELELEDKIHYMGTKDNVQEYLQAMDMIVFPSLYEGFPLSIVEAQLSGLPCLISNGVNTNCNILGTANYLPIDQGVDIWVDAIKKTQCDETIRQSYNTKKVFTEAGFNILDNAENLKNIYMNLYRR